MDLETEVQFLHGVGPKMAEKLKRLGVETAHNLIYYFPRDYADYTKITKIGGIGSSNIKTQISNEAQNPNVTIKAKIINIANRRTSRRRFVVTEAVVADDTGSIKVVWFNQPFLEKMLKAGQEIILNGKISIDPFSNQLQMESPTRTNFPRIVPIYPETVGITSGDRFIPGVFYAMFR
jgi:ATP-dependent DNA helicase RecG